MARSRQQRTMIALLVLCAGVVPGVIQYQSRTRAPEHERAMRNWPSELYHLATGDAYLVRADCPDADHRGPKLREAASTKPMREVIVHAADDDSAAQFVSERFAGCRYMLLGRI